MTGPERDDSANGDWLRISVSQKPGRGITQAAEIRCLSPFVSLKQTERASGSRACPASVRAVLAPDRVTSLVRRLNVPRHEADIRRCLQLVCGESLRSGAGWSSLNIDGTPVQFALSSVKGQQPAFEFIGEAFRTGMDYAERRAFGLDSMTRLAEEIGVKAELDSVQSHLAAMANAAPAKDYEDPAGAFWLGASFEPRDPASMVMYANARRGTETARWHRLSEFAASIVDADWPRVFEVAKTWGFKPLGAGVRIRKRRPFDVRIYFAAYGVTLQDYRRMFRKAGAGEAFDSVLTTFFGAALGADAAFPTRSAVFSFGSNGDREWSPKLELCAHCAWRGDDEAEMRCSAWLDRMGMDTDLYRDVFGILARGRRTDAAGVHAYAGVGTRRDQPYVSIYLNPGPGGL